MSGGGREVDAVASDHVRQVHSSPTWQQVVSFSQPLAVESSFDEIYTCRVNGLLLVIIWGFELSRGVVTTALANGSRGIVRKRGESPKVGPLGNRQRPLTR